MADVDDLKHIRSMMERSSKFSSISGLSCILAGISAIVGAVVVHQIVYLKQFTILSSPLSDTIFIALLVLGAAMFFGLYFSYKKACKQGELIWSNLTFQLLKDVGVPLVTGGLLCLIFIYHHLAYLIPAVMLIFCGIAAVNAGARSYRNLKALGVIQILLGLLAGLFFSYGLLLWALGFGFCFIVYGGYIYLKYDRKILNKPE